MPEPTIGAWEVVGLALFSALLAAALISDVRYLRIPNVLSVALVVTLVIVRLAAGQAGTLPMGLAAGAAALVVGIVLYALGVWGGGDAKLMAAVVAWTGFEGVVRLVLVTAVAGGVLALAILLLRRWRPASPMPYGVAIAVGGGDWVLSVIL